MAASSSTTKKISPLDNILNEFKRLYNSSSEQLINATPPKEMWRYFIDYPANEGWQKVAAGKAEELPELMRKNGWLKFTEPNYLVALGRSFHMVMTESMDHSAVNFVEVLSELLVSLQKVATHKVLQNKTGFCDFPLMRYGLTDVRNTTREGFNELLEDVKNDLERYIFLTQGDEDDPINRVCLAGTDKHIIEMVKDSYRATLQDISNISDDEIKRIYDKYVASHSEEFAAAAVTLTIPYSNNKKTISEIKREKIANYALKYQHDIITAATMADKLTAIANFTAQIVRYHSFKDGNARSKAILLLNFLLKINGFPPAIINPNFSGGYSFKQWEAEILDGMGRALDLAKNHTLPCIPTDKILEYATLEEKSSFEESVNIEKIGRELRQLSNCFQETKDPIYSAGLSTIKKELEKLMYEGNINKKNSSFIMRTLNEIFAINKQTLKEKEKLELIRILLINEITPPSPEAVSPLLKSSITREFAITDPKLLGAYLEILRTLLPAPTLSPRATGRRD